MNNNQKGQGFNKYKTKRKNEKYILLLFISSIFSPQKDSNRLTDPGKEIKSLNHLVCILKIRYSKKY